MKIRWFFLGGWVSRQWFQYNYAQLFQLLGEDSLGAHGVKQPTGSGGTMISQLPNSRVGTDASDLLSIDTLLGGNLKNSCGKTLHPDGSSSSWEADEIARDHDDAAAAKDEYDEYDE